MRRALQIAGLVAALSAGVLGPALSKASGGQPPSDGASKGRPNTFPAPNVMMAAGGTQLQKVKVFEDDAILSWKHTAGGGGGVRRYEFRLDRRGDPRGQLTLEEAELVEGEDAQTNTLRWQDYTQTAIDPEDDCTIWYVGDYVNKSAASYSTRIGAFQLPGCGS